jgi:hypothetical protein
VSDDQSGGAVRILNVSGKNQRIKRGSCFGGLERADVCKMQPAIDITEPDTRRQIAPPTTTSATGYVEPIQTNESIELWLLALPEDLTPEQRSQAENLIRRNMDVFLNNDFDIGRTHLVQHRIDIGSHRPLRQPVRRHPLAHLDLIDAHVDQMLQQDIIEPEASPWASYVVLVREKVAR